MIQTRPIQETVMPVRRIPYAKLIFIYLCWALSLPGTLFCQGINLIRVKHVLNIYGDFNQPTEVAVGMKGSVYVLDGANNKVKIFNRNGKFVRSVGRSGKGEGEFGYPVGMDIDAQGDIYIADTGNRRIQVLGSNGNYLRKIDLSRWHARPVAVKVAGSTHHIYVSDANNHQILCFKKDGTFKFSWGGIGEKPGQFRFPGMTAIDLNGEFYVVDILNGRVQAFSAQGKHPQPISELGVSPGQLFRPKGITVDPRFLIYVSDSYTGIIQVFDKSGKFHGILSTDAKTFLRLTTPLGLAFDTQGRLYVVQSTLNKISVFVLREK
jgi:DNA-binding beta-propeller fold protein YncE